jgi:mono/diheme cytochrome c family protein
VASAGAQEGGGPPSALYGKTIYRVYCASCHGAEGAGDGKLAEYLTVKPADLTAIVRRNDGDFPAERLVDVIDGRQPVRGHAGEMPVWGDAFQKADALENEPPEVREKEVKRKIEALVAYLRSIQVQEE